MGLLSWLQGESSLEGLNSRLIFASGGPWNITVGAKKQKEMFLIEHINKSAVKCFRRRFFSTIKLPYFTGNDNRLWSIKALRSAYQYHGAEQHMQSKHSPLISIIAKSILMNQCGRNSMIVNDFPPRTVTISPWISASSSHIRRHIMANATGSTRVEPDKSPRLYWA